MPQRGEPTPGTTRRDVLRRGAKLAYVTPAVLAAIKVESTYAASGGTGPTGGNPGGGKKDKDKDKDKDKK